MTGRPYSRPLLLALALAAAVAGCGRDRTPRRVPDDGAPCSAIMPGTPESEEATFRLDSVVMSERAWGLKPPEVRVDPPQDLTVYVVRRVTVSEPGDSKFLPGEVVVANTPGAGVCRNAPS